MLPPEVSQRHRSLITEVVGQWRRWSKRVTADPSLPYEDDDDVLTDRSRVFAEVLGRIAGAISKLDIAGCEKPEDVDLRVAALVKRHVANDDRDGVREASQLVLRKLAIPLQASTLESSTEDNSIVS
jgi:hypothetical protein